MTTTMTQAVARLLLLPGLVIAAAILVKGYSDVGDGFAAGVVAALAVLLQYVAFGFREARRHLPPTLVPAAVLGGLLLALLVAFVPLAWGAPPFTHYPPPGADILRLGTLELLTTVAFDLGVFLLVFGVAVGAIDLVARAVDGRRA